MGGYGAKRGGTKKSEEQDVRDLGFAGLKACGRLRDQVCIHQADEVASEIQDWSQRARAQHGKKKEIVPEKLDNPPKTQQVRTCLAACAQSDHSHALINILRNMYILTKRPDDISQSNSMAGTLLGSMPFIP